MPQIQRTSRFLNHELLERRELLATTIPYGQIVNGAIDRTGEVDEFVFNASQNAEVDMILTSSPRQTGFSAYAEVFAPSGTRIDAFAANWGNRRLSLRETGSFIVRIRDDNRQEVGNYTLGLEGIRPISPNPGVLVKGGIVAGEIGQSIEKDQFVFSAASNDIVDLIITSVPRQSGFVLYAEVFGPAGNRIDAFAANWGNRRLTLPQAGTYMVMVRDDNYTELGSYEIGLESLRPISPNPISLIKGGIVNESIGHKIEKDQFTFTAATGNIVDLLVTSLPVQTGFIAYAEVFAPSGNRIDAFYANHGNRRLSLSESGTYMIQVRDDNFAETGGFRIGLEGISPISPDSIPLTKGGLVSGWMSQTLKKDQYTFTAGSNEIVDIIMASYPAQAGFNPYAEVFDSTGNRIDAFYANWGNRRLTLSRADTYMVMVRDDNFTEFGNYVIGLEGIRPISPNPISLINGGIVSGASSHKLEKDQYIFTATAGAIVDLVMTSTPLQAGYLAYAEVFAPSGTRVDAFSANWGNRRLALTESGTYMVQVRDDNYSEIGQFQIGLEGIRPLSPNPTTLVRGLPALKTIGQALQKDQFTFSGSRNQTIDLHLNGTPSTAGFNVYAEVFAPSGNRVDAFYGSWGTRRLTLTESGLYMIMVYDAHLSQRGTYSLRWL